MPSAKPRSTPASELLDFHRNPELLARLAEASGPGLISIDAKGRFVAWSAGAERITGYGQAEVHGQPCQMFEGRGCKGFGELARLLQSPEQGSEAAQAMDFQICVKGKRKLYLRGYVQWLTGDGRRVGALVSFVELSEELSALESRASAGGLPGLAGLIGQSPAMDEIFRRIRLAADSDVTTLIVGESGTGKEVAARAIHSLSERRDEPYVAINCSAIPENLMESELFGHAKGAFTGAIRDRAGVFEAAHGGTLLLDEIGDVSPLIQLKLLRVLQEREVQRVGDERPIPIDVRLITATNRDLEERVAMGQIREDFYYRIRVFDIHMPALRERAVDIPLLAEHFVQRASKAGGRPQPRLASETLDALMRHSWPGNVRELNNTMERALVMHQGGLIETTDLPGELCRSAGSKPTPQAAQALTSAQEKERLEILEALEANAWNRTRSAEALGYSRVTLWKKIRRLGIDQGIFKRGTRETLS